MTTSTSHRLTDAGIGARRVPIPDRVVGNILLDRAEASGDSPYLRVADGQLLTVGQVAEQALRVAGGLAALGVKRGDAVALFLPTCEEAVLGWLGSALLGAVEVPVNSNLTGLLLRHVLADSGARVVVVSTGLLPVLLDVIGDGSLPVERVVLVSRGGGLASPALPSGAGLVSWDEVASGAPTVDRTLRPRDPIAVMYTSGTTGPAKGVVCPHGYFTCWADDVGRAVRFSAGDVLYSPLPLFHITAQTVNILLALLHEGRVIMDSRFSPKDFWRRMAMLGTTHVWSFGSMTPLLFKAPPDDGDRLHSARVFWSIPWPTGYGREFQDRFGVKMMCGYGSTEQGLTVVQPYDETEPDTLGRPSPHYELKVVDDLDEPVPPGEPGQLLVRPREPAAMMSGYLNRADVTMQSFRGLWYHTGDRVRLRADGFVEFVERQGDSIRRRGENISSWEIETVVAQHPGVGEVAVVGVPSPLGEHDVLLAVVLAEGSTLTREQMFDYCVERLPYYMVPRYVRFLDEMPMTPSMRVQRFALREQGISPDTWDAEAHGIRLRKPETS
jgi:crotonobetaine/carnitine-CoA ligase